MKKILISLLTMLVSVASFAQTTETETSYPYGFVGVQAGAVRAYSGTDIDCKWSPAGALQLGIMTKVIGARLQGYGTSWTADAPEGKYDSKMLGADVDMLFNLSNALFPNRENKLNVMAVAGLPFELALHHTYMDNYAKRSGSTSDKWSPSIKLGGILDFDVARHWAVNVEGGTFLLEDEHWMPYLMAGIAFKFGNRKAKAVTPVSAPVVAPVEEEPVAPVVEEKKPEPQPEPAPVVVKEPEKTTQNIFFTIGKMVIKNDQQQKVNDLADWAKEHPTANIQLTGYADKATGSARINQALSERRAAAVKDQLIKKGVSADRISTEGKGDTEQPFAKNNDNRVVIAVGEEK